MFITHYSRDSGGYRQVPYWAVTPNCEKRWRFDSSLSHRLIKYNKEVYMSDTQATCHNCGCSIDGPPWPHIAQPMHWSSTDCIRALKSRIASLESTMKLLEKNLGSMPASRRAEGYATTFYVKSAKHSWGRDEGYKLQIDFVNFVGPGASR